jgi:hypothetical protein
MTIAPLLLVNRGMHMQIDIQGKPIAATVVQYATRTGRHEVEWPQDACLLGPEAKGTQSNSAWVDFAADIAYREVV